MEPLLAFAIIIYSIVVIWHARHVERLHDDVIEYIDRYIIKPTKQKEQGE